MNLYYCEHTSKGNRNVVATSMIHALKLFTDSIRFTPEKITLVDNNVILETTLSIVKQEAPDDYL